MRERRRARPGEGSVRRREETGRGREEMSLGFKILGKEEMSVAERREGHTLGRRRSPEASVGGPEGTCRERGCFFLKTKGMFVFEDSGPKTYAGMVCGRETQ